MKLYAEGPSHMEDMESLPLPTEPEPQWTVEISLAEAASLLEKRMYPFKEASLHIGRFGAFGHLDELPSVLRISG